MKATALAGVLLGLGAAFSQACSYFGSRRYLTEYENRPFKVFVIAHVQMGAMVLLIPFVLDNPLPPLGAFAPYLVGTSGSYLFGQFMLLTALTRSDSSVVAPLLGMKIPILALVSAGFLGVLLPWHAWLAVFLCAAAAFMVSPPRRLPQIRVLVLAILACFGYCGSDLCIPPLVAAFETASSTPALLAVCISYTLSGGGALIVSWRLGYITDRKAHAYTLPYSFCWILGMCFLFACFATVGVIFGNMLQSTRSFLSVIIGVFVARAGLVHIESAKRPRVFAVRFAGAAVMTAAIVLYYSAKLSG